MARGMLYIDKRQRRRLAREARELAVWAVLPIPLVMLLIYASFDGRYRYHFLIDSFVLGVLWSAGLAAYWIASAYVKMLFRKDSIYGNIFKAFTKDLVTVFAIVQVLLPPALYMIMSDVPLAAFGVVISACFDLAVVSGILIALGMACINLYKAIRAVGLFKFFVVLSCSFFICIMMAQHLVLDLPFDYSMAGLVAVCMGLSAFITSMLWVVGYLRKDGKVEHVG